MARYFFPCTISAASEITKLFDFAWPTAAALWNLRWQVNGFLNVVPAASPEQLNDRFVFGSDIHGANLRRACHEISWDDQKATFASFILTNAFAVYERWAEEIVHTLGAPVLWGERLQFEDNGKRMGLPGLHGTITALCAVESVTIKNAYFPVFSASPKYSAVLLPNLLKCYRYFKAARNTQIHRGGIADNFDVGVYQQFAPVSDKASLGMKGALVHEPLVAGQIVKLHLRGVVGFCDVLLRLMATIDADLCKSKKAEPNLERRLREAAGGRRMLSANAHRRGRQVANICMRAGLPRPAAIGIVQEFLREKRIVAF